MTERLGLSDIRSAATKLSAVRPLPNNDGVFTLVLHASVVADIVGAEARRRWKAEYRRQRLARKGIVEQLPLSEVGVIRGFRFVTSANL